MTDARTRGQTRAVAAVGLVAAAFVLTAVWGRSLGPRILLDAAPFVGVWRLRAGMGTLLAVAVAASVLWRGVALAERLPWRALPACAFAASVAWGVSLALVDGAPGLTAGVSSPHDYLAAVPDVGTPGRFVRTFVDRIGTLPVHVRSHPPGLVIGLWWLDRAGLGGVLAPAAIAIAAGASTVPAALVAAKQAGGAALARRAAPFLVLAPAAIWMVTSADAIYAGVTAWSVAALAGAVAKDGWRADAAGLAGGVLLGASLHLSYGLILVVPVAVALPVVRRRARVLALAAAGAGAVTAIFVANGFWWLEGLFAARREYAEGVAADRPLAFFLVSNLVAFAVVVGPAAVAGLASMRERAPWILVLPALIAVALADVSGLSKGEVERIWLPFWPWVALAASALPDDGRRAWLAASALTAIAVQSVVFSPW